MMFDISTILLNQLNPLLRYRFGAAETSLIILIVIIAIAVALIPAIFYLLTLSKALSACSPHNQRMTPGQVWLVLIPIFGIVWHFLMIGYIADSLAAEFKERNLPLRDERPGFAIGITFLILQLCGIIPILGVLASLGGLVCWIIYWVKISEYKNQLERMQTRY